MSAQTATPLVKTACAGCRDVPWDGPRFFARPTLAHAPPPQPPRSGSYQCCECRQWRSVQQKMGFCLKHRQTQADEERNTRSLQAEKRKVSQATQLGPGSPRGHQVLKENVG